MKLIAHVLPDGSIKELIAVPASGITAMKVPAPDIQVCEITNHGIEEDTIEAAQLVKLREKYVVELNDDQGQFKARRS